MTNTQKTTPRDVYLNLLTIAMLYISVISFIALSFQYVNYLFPDQLESYRFFNSFETIRRSIASLIVVWPVYIWISWIINRDIKKAPEKIEIKIRKWLLYLTLFIAAITIIIDVITLIFNFLGGELTISFALKILSVLIVAGAVFGYYLWNLKLRENDTSRKQKLIAWISSAVIIISIIAGFFITGTPSQQRVRRFDEQRISHLQSIQNQLVNYYQQKGQLPETLETLTNDFTSFTPHVDPETNNAYKYARISEREFELCAVFNTKSRKNNKQSRGLERPFGVKSSQWDHGAGNICFTRTIDPDMFPAKSLFPESVRIKD